jgi:hypothetical protein
MDDVDSPCLRVGIMAAVKRAQCRVSGVPASRAAAEAGVAPRWSLKVGESVQTTESVTLVGRVDEG